MQLEIGSIVQGKITGITKFGAFVELEGGGTGLVHISEISDDYVTEISDYIQIGNIIKVKILNIDGTKVALSIKQTNPSNSSGHKSRCASVNSSASKPVSERKPRAPRPQVYRGTPKREEPQTFEDMLSRFKQNSEEKMSDIKRNIDGKRGSYSRKR